MVEYEKADWPGQIRRIQGSRAHVACYQKAHGIPGSTWKWPEKEDLHDYPLTDVKYKIDIPKGVNFTSKAVRVPELEHIWGK